MSFILRNKIFLPLLITFLFIGCGYKQTNTQIRDVGYLKFNKSKTDTFIVIVNDTYKFKLDSCQTQNETDHCHDDTVDKLYEISSGNAVIEVYDNKNNLLMRKEIYVGSSDTVEVDL